MEFNESEDFLEDNDYREYIMDVIPYADLESTFDAVLEFIKWYNENK